MAETVYGRAMRRKRKEQRQRERERKKAHLKPSGGEICGAQRRTGGTCKMAAGFGTNHLGFGRCKYHGGSTPNGRLNSAKQEAIFMGAPKEINPVEALTWCIHITAGEIEWFSERIAELDKEDWFEQSILGKQMNIMVRERDNAIVRLARFSKDAISLGIAERRVRIAEQYGAALARLLKGILDDLELSEVQRQRAPAIVRKHLILLEGRQVPLTIDQKAITAA